MRPRISEETAERFCDLKVQRRLSRDRAYLHAEDAEAQAAREDKITREVWADLESRYEIGES